MLNLKFKLANSQIIRLDSENIAENSRNCTAYFELGEDWAEPVTAYFSAKVGNERKKFKVILENQSCTIPNDLTSAVTTISVSAACKDRLTTNIVSISVIPSAVCDDSEIPSEPEPSAYEQVLKKLEELNNKISDIEVGSGGTSDYSELSNKPQINGVELNGNKTSDELGINAEKLTFSDGQTLQAKLDSGELKGEQGDDYILTEQDKEEIANIAISDIKDGDEVKY